MIPTLAKAKLPRHLAYPVGARAISESLAGVAAVEALAAMFLDRAVWPGAELRRVLQQRLPYRVMAAEHRPARKPGYGGSRIMIERGLYGDRSELTVYPVLTGLKCLANQLLLTEGLPAIAKWLKDSGRPGWGAAYRRIELMFHPASGSLTAQEVSGA